MPLKLKFFRRFWTTFGSRRPRAKVPASSVRPERPNAIRTKGWRRHFRGLIAVDDFPRSRTRRGLGHKNAGRTGSALYRLPSSVSFGGQHHSLRSRRIHLGGNF